MPRAGAGRGRQCVGGVGAHHFAIRGSDAPETKSPRMGFQGWDSGSGRDGWERERRPGAAGYQPPPPREIPPRGVRKGGGAG